MNYYEDVMRACQHENKALKRRLNSAERRNGFLFMLSLIGWSIMVLVLTFPDKVCASERWSSTVIRCQQSSDTCIKRESVFYTEQDCDRENAKVVEAIGKTDDVVVAFCQSGK